MEEITTQFNPRLIEFIVISITILFCFLFGYILAHLIKMRKIKKLNRALEDNTVLLQQSNEEVANLKGLNKELSHYKSVTGLTHFKEENEQFKKLNALAMADNFDKEKQIVELSAERAAYEKDNTVHKELTPFKKVGLIYELVSIIGEEKKRDKNDLTELAGISKVIEQTLNANGIYTYKQLSRLNKRSIKIIEQLTRIPAFKITESDWVGQAKELL